jgi:hypothetical protein
VLRGQADDMRLRSVERLEDRIASLQGLTQSTTVILLGPSLTLWLIAPLVARL